jgi:hypothetical protein
MPSPMTAKEKETQMHDSNTAEQTLEDVLDELVAAERPKGKGDRWRWEPGDRLVLRLDDAGEVDGKFGTRPFLRGLVEGGVSTEGGGEPLEAGTRRTFYLDAAVLQSFYEAEKPQSGDLVAAVYQGKTDDGVHDFRAKVVERGMNPDGDIPFD